MLDVNKPMEAIEEWQNWYRSHRVVAEMDEPLVTKESRKNLHDTSNTATTLGQAYKQSVSQSTDSVSMKSLSSITPKDLVERTKAVSMQTAEEYFADTIAEFLGELSGKELYKAFYAAAVNNLSSAEKEYNKAKQLVNMLHCNNVAP
jgi:hypothetical protein